MTDQPATQEVRDLPEPLTLLDIEVDVYQEDVEYYTKQARFYLEVDSHEKGER